VAGDDTTNDPVVRESYYNEIMYDPLTSTYAFSCPHGRAARIPLSAFRTLERLPGAAHPAVYRIRFACGCGREHPGLIAHDDLDWAPLDRLLAEFLVEPELRRTALASSFTATLEMTREGALHPIDLAHIHAQPNDLHDNRVAPVRRRGPTRR